MVSKKGFKTPRKSNHIFKSSRVIRWEVVAPKEARLSPIQSYDLVFDEHDLRIRQLG